MHPLRLAVLPSVLALACGDSSSGGTFGESASQPSAASADTGATDVASATLPTTGHGDPSTTSAADTGIGPVASTSSAADSTSSADDSTSAVSASTTADDSTSTVDDSTSSDTNCPEGTENCPCGPNDTCDGGLTCQADLCLPPPCPEGTQGCPCGPDDACDNGLDCQADLCLPPGCPEGTEGCPCAPNNTCNNGLTCQAGLCVDAPVCGDGVVEGNEACDNGNQNSNTGACKLDCSKQTCGDGFTGPGEACDAGDQNSNTGSCKLDCSKQTCGDGFTGPGEECDAGNQNSNTGACKTDCSKQTCGDGYVGPGEACDDGNANNGDGCQTNCTLTPQGVDNCGQPGDGIWIEIDYGSAFSPTNPSWKYGGWTESQWAPQGQNWPYINALGGITVQMDQGVIGKVALLNGSNKELRVFIGLGPLIDYDHVTACVEGRSYSVGSSVTFRVENALNDCGGQAMMSNDWFSLHPTAVDVGNDCFIPGNDFQAIAIRPVGGSSALSLRRMRVTFHGAVF